MFGAGKCDGGARGGPISASYEYFIVPLLDPVNGKDVTRAELKLIPLRRGIGDAADLKRTFIEER